MRFLLVSLAILSPALFAQELPTDPGGGGTALAQTGQLKARPAGSTPKAADGKPDLSGLWDHPFVIDMSLDGRNDANHKR